MMKRANPGVSDPSKMKPPLGYKSALGKARDAHKAKLAKQKGRVNSVQDSASDDTASEDEFSDSDSMNFSIKALRPAVKPKMNAVRLSSYKEALIGEEPQDIDITNDNRNFAAVKEECIKTGNALPPHWADLHPELNQTNNIVKLSNKFQCLDSKTRITDDDV